MRSQAIQINSLLAYGICESPLNAIKTCLSPKNSFFLKPTSATGDIGMYQDEPSAHSLPLIEQSALINLRDIDDEEMQTPQLLTQPNENSFVEDFASTFINDMQGTNDNNGNIENIQMQNSNQIFTAEFTNNCSNGGIIHNEHSLTNTHRLMIPTIEEAHVQQNISSNNIQNSACQANNNSQYELDNNRNQIENSQLYNSSSFHQYMPRNALQQQSHQQMFQQQMNLDMNMNNNLSEDDIFLDTTSLNSFDFGRALQNLSNQNLEDLLDFDPPENSMKVCNQDNSSNINDQSNISQTSNTQEQNSRSQINNSDQSFNKRNMKSSQLKSPKKKRKYLGQSQNNFAGECSLSNSNMCSGGGNTGTTFCGSGFENGTGEQSNGNVAGNHNGNEESFGNNSINRGSNLRLSNSFQEIFQIQKVQRDQFPPTVTENILEEIDEDINSVSEERGDEEEKVQSESPKIDDKLSRQKFNFLYRRTCFRSMKDYYQYWFASYVKKKKVHRDLKNLMTNFTQSTFGPVLASLPHLQMKKDLNSNLTTIIHAHRHNNSSMLNLTTSSKDSAGNGIDQSFSEIDFTIIRDVMYKYSQKAEKKFFQVPEYSFFFGYYATNSNNVLIKQKLELKGPDYCKRILKDIEEMKCEAIRSLQHHAQYHHSEKAQIFLQILSNRAIKLQQDLLGIRFSAASLASGTAPNSGQGIIEGQQ